MYQIFCLKDLFKGDISKQEAKEDNHSHSAEIYLVMKNPDLNVKILFLKC